MKIELGWENSDRLYLHVEDVGHGAAVVLVHGWPCSSMVWEDLRSELLTAGYRVITYDRRGFGRSGRPSTGYDLDTLTEDLARLMDVLELEDASVIGFGAGCGEVLRLLGTFGEARVARVALVSPLPLVPCGGKDGTEGPAMKHLRDALSHDRCQALASHLGAAFRTGPKRSSSACQDARAIWLHDACANSAHALRSMLSAGYQDLREDAVRVKIPALIVSGGGDQIAPIRNAEALASALPLSRLLTVSSAPHALLVTHTFELTQALLNFLPQP